MKDKRIDVIKVRGGASVVCSSGPAGKRWLEEL